jgi:hypothetical protein
VCTRPLRIGLPFAAVEADNAPDDEAEPLAMPITMVAGKRLALITIRSVDPDLNVRLGDFIAGHLYANRERRRHPRSLLRRMYDAVTPDAQYDIDGACFRYETGNFKLERDEYVPDAQPR